MRFNEEMARVTHQHLVDALDPLWDRYNALPNPSSESIEVLRHIRAVEKTLRVIEATMDRHGWTE